MKKTIILFALLPVLSCNNKHNGNKTNTNDATTIKELTIKWNDGLNKHDLQTLSSFYADQVSFYGTSFSKEQVISSKKDFLKKHPDFKQDITGEIVITKVNDQQYKSSFTKHSVFNGHTLDVPGYLLFNKVSNFWKITNESDQLSDKNISKRKRQPYTCFDIVMKILTTSPRYLEKTKGLHEAVVENGGITFGVTLDGSPNPETDGAIDYSDTYDFILHETYSDHMPTIARYTFNPTDEQLYEYDVVEDAFHPIDFDKSLLIKFKKICK